MHLLQDENGNPIPHGHEGEQGHCHKHEHCAAAEGGACPGGEGGHEHGHHHHHEHAPMDTKEQMAVLLDYMLKHNQSHAAELDKLAGKLAEKELIEASEQVRKAVDEFSKGNLYLSLALSSVKNGEA